VGQFEFDPKRQAEVKDPGARAVRPKDAATLILMRHVEGKPQVLMGQRHQGHSFMPNKFVFPGGRVSVSDTRLKPLEPLRSDVEAQLRLHTKRRNVQSLALAAVRETFEETGLLVGQKTRPENTGLAFSRSREWKPFLDQGVAPVLHRFDFVARAITPPYRTKRFDARFFVARADLIQNDENHLADTDGELLKLKWFALDEAQTLDLPNITRVVLDLIDEREKNQSNPVRPLFMRFRHGKRYTDYL